MTTVGSGTPPPLPPTSALADVLGLWGIDGVLTPPMMPMAATGGAVAGKVVTVSFDVAPGGEGITSLYDLLSGDLTGSVLVLAGLGPLPGAAFGEILATSARDHGAVAVLVDGAVRDLSSLDELGMPVYGRRRVIAGPNGGANVVGVGTTVDIGGVHVSTGDLLVADAEGCVCLPAGRQERLVDAAVRYALAEERLLTAVRAGAAINEAYAIKKTVVSILAAEADEAHRLQP